MNLHSAKETHWVLCKNKNHFGSYGYPQLEFLSDSVIKRNQKSAFFQYRKQNIDKYCADYCLYKIHESEKLKNDFISGLLFLHYNKYWQ